MNSEPQTNALRALEHATPRPSDEIREERKPKFGPDFKGISPFGFTRIANDAIDSVMPFVSPSEWKVYSYIYRKTLGYQKQVDRISISQMVNGIKTADGRQVDYGTGLSNRVVIAATKSLAEKGLIDKIVPKASRMGNQMRSYSIRTQQSDEKSLGDTRQNDETSSGENDEKSYTKENLSIENLKPKRRQQENAAGSSLPSPQNESQNSASQKSGMAQAQPIRERRTGMNDPAPGCTIGDIEGLAEALSHFLLNESQAATERREACWKDANDVAKAANGHPVQTVVAHFRDAASRGRLKQVRGYGWFLDEARRHFRHPYIPPAPEANVGTGPFGSGPTVGDLDDLRHEAEAHERRQAELRAHPERCERCRGEGTQHHKHSGKGVFHVWCGCPRGDDLRAAYGNAHEYVRQRSAA